MKIVGISIGLPRSVSSGASEVVTAIFKERASGRVAVTKLGLEGDGQADSVDHGGENKAVYGYPIEHYAFWEKELGRSDLLPGQFGENLTLDGLTETVGIGDVYAVGSARLQVSQPRKPCFKLGIRMGDPLFVKRFHRSARTGFYFRVVQPGDIGEGDPIVRVAVGQFGFSIHDLWHLVFERRDGADEARRALEIPWLADEFRLPLMRRVHRAEPPE